MKDNWSNSEEFGVILAITPSEVVEKPPPLVNEGSENRVGFSTPKSSDRKIPKFSGALRARLIEISRRTSSVIL